MLKNILAISLSMSVVIFLLLIISPFLNKRYSARWRYFVWLMIALRLVIPVKMEWHQAPVTISVPNQTVVFRQEGVPVAILDSSYIEQGRISSVSAGYVPMIPLKELLAVIWAAGAISFFLYHIIHYIIFKRRIEPYCSRVHIEIFDTVLSNMKVQIKPQLLLCSKIASPMLIGFFKPTILLPSINYSDNELSVVLKHELIHYKRGDVWYKLLLVVANSVHWFNPFVYLMVKAANRDLEYSCDDAVVKNSDINFRKEYSLAILKTMQNGEDTILSTGFSESGEKAKKRFDNILHAKVKKTGVIAFIIIMGIILSAGTLVVCNSRNRSTWNVAEKQIRELYNSKIKYVGNNSGVAKIVGLLPFAEGVKVEKLELHTDSEPYGITLYYIIDEYDKVVHNNTVNFDGFYKNAILMFCLIDNADHITINVRDPIKNEDKMYSNTYLRTDFDNIFDKPLREYSTNYEDFKMLFHTISTSNNITDIDRAVSDAILKSNSNGYGKGECVAEGHIILGTSDMGGKSEKKFIETYVLATYGEYGFQNGNFVKTSGSGIIPTRITFEVDDSGRYTLVEYKQAKDGSEYVASVKEMFPKEYWDRALSASREDHDECKKQERAYAKAYLESIGRITEIGDYADFKYELPNMNVNASNSLLSQFVEYPYWIGTQEKIENGIRYVYETQWEDKGNGDGTVTYKKYEFDSKKVVQETVLEIKNGEIIYLKRTP